MYKAKQKKYSNDKLPYTIISLHEICLNTFLSMVCKIQVPKMITFSVRNFTNEYAQLLQFPLFWIAMSCKILLGLHLFIATTGISRIQIIYQWVANCFATLYVKQWNHSILIDE